jgi:hypothetical protein
MIWNAALASARFNNAATVANRPMNLLNLNQAIPACPARANDYFASENA